METVTANRFLKSYVKNANIKRIPLAGTIELNTNCNFKCLHCYQVTPHQSLSLSDFKAYLTQVKASGCIFLTITGGEPLLHPDFFTMYEWAWKRGFALTVYSNGSLITLNHISLFKKYPPKHLDLTLYGATPATYLKVTGCNAYEQVLTNLKLLVAAGIRVRLKTFLLKDNFKEYEQIKALAKKYAVHFRYDYHIMPNLNLDQAGLKYQLTTAQIKVLEKIELDPNKLSQMKAKGRCGNNLFNCTAGRSSFVISSGGQVKLCTFGLIPSYSLKELDFKTIWDKLGEVVKQQIDPSSPCYDCSYMEFCTNCPVKTYVTLGTKDLCLKPVKKYCADAKKMQALYIEQTAKKREQLKKALTTICEKGLNEGNLIKGKIYGSSMEPTLKPGAVIYLQAQAQYQVHDIVAFKRTTGNFFIVHRVLKIKEDVYYIEGDNNIGHGEWVPLNKILGKVVKSVK